jgi:zinc transport system ATP-binding protein
MDSKDAILPLIEAINISHHYEERKVLTNVSFSIFPNEIVTLIGPNGAGKSTILKILLSLIEPTSGSVRKPDSLSIGFMPQKVNLDNSLPLTVERFLQLALNKKILTSIWKRKESKEIEETLQQLDIQSLRNQQLKNLSGGEFQRVLLARAIIKKPQLLILDEPVQGVDLQGQTELYHLINSIKDTLKCGVLMVSHDLHVVMKSTNKVLCLNQHLCCSGHPNIISENKDFQKIFGTGFEEVAFYEHHHNNNQCNHTHGNEH